MARNVLRMMACGALLVCGIAEGYAQGVVLRTSTFNTGAGSSNSGGYVLHSTLGQPIVGRSADAAYSVHAGFWYQVKPTSPVVLNSPPAAPQITDPADGTQVVLGGASGAAPVDPATPFTVAWTPAADPDGDPVSYTWQLATASDFATLVWNQDTGTDARFETTLGDLVARLDVPGVTRPGDATTLWHRAVASDGQLATAGTAVRITFIRGTLVSAEDDHAQIPAHFDLHANYPNPFNPQTTIAYDLPQRAPVRLVVYDLFGRAVKTLVAASQPAGRYTVQFEAGDLASGTYFYRIEAGTYTRTRQFILLK